MLQPCFHPAAVGRCDYLIFIRLHPVDGKPAIASIYHLINQIHSNKYHDANTGPPGTLRYPGGRLFFVYSIKPKC